MSKQCYLIFIFVLLALALNAEVQIQSGLFSVNGNGDNTYLNQTRIDANYQLLPQLSLLYSAKLDAADRKLGNFSQNKWLSNYMGVDYRSKHLQVSAAYRNLAFGTAQSLPLYQEWRGDLELARRMQHQTQIEAKSSFGGMELSAFGIHKHLDTTPTEYVFNFDTFEMEAVQMPDRAFDDAYYGVQATYRVTPFLNLRAGTDIQQANFTKNEIYDINTVAFGAQLQLEPKATTRISGSFDWENRAGEDLEPVTRNMFYTSLRLQQSLGMNINGFISLLNTSCTDDEMSDLYLISNQIRSQVQYHFSYDPNQASYINAGLKISPEFRTNTYFAEGQFLLMNHLYAMLNFKRIERSLSNYQAKVSFFPGPFTECFLQYTISSPDNGDKSLNYFGVGTSIRL